MKILLCEGAEMVDTGPPSDLSGRLKILTPK